MSWDLNHVNLIGRLTRDPEIRYSQQGNSYTVFSIAVNRRSGASKEKPSNEVSYFTIVIFGKLAEICNEYLTKGKQVAVSGYLRQKRWEKDGEKFSSIEILAEHVQFLTPNVNADGNYIKRDVASSNNNDKLKNSFKKKDEKSYADDSMDVDDEIPF